MAFRKQLVLPIAALLISGIIAANASESAELLESAEDKPNGDIVSQQLAEGEMALKHLLGEEVELLDKMLKTMIQELSETYGVSEAELSHVAKEAMQKIANMDISTLQSTLGQLAGLGGSNLNNPEALQELLNKLSGTDLSGDGI